jgi:hypothetical protein
VSLKRGIVTVAVVVGERMIAEGKIEKMAVRAVDNCYAEVPGVAVETGTFVDFCRLGAVERNHGHRILVG